MKITSDFAPPLSTIAPFFLIGAVFYVFACVALFGIDIKASYADFAVVGWVHLFLVGFVMTTILGAMGQLIPVVLEKGHSFVQFFTIIPYLLLLGIFLLMSGFWLNPAFLPYGGLIVMMAITIYLTDAFATLLKAERSSLSVRTMGVSHLFLIAALIVGFLMTLFFSYGIHINIKAALLTHIAFSVGGYVFLVIVGVAVILLPMFGLAHGFDEKAAWRSFWSLAVGILLICIFSFFDFYFGVTAGFLLVLASMSFFGYQVALIHSKRVRKERDIWYRSLIVSFSSLALSLVFMALAAVSGDEKLIKLSGFIFGLGFLSFLISGHLYKIIPFLVWFERFSPLVGKQKIPMLHQMVPKKAAEYQLWFGLFGLILCSLGLWFENQIIWFSGVSFLCVSSLFLLSGTLWMIRFR